MEVMDVTIFVSHSSQDLKVASRVSEFLEKHGHTCWVANRDEIAGVDYRDPLMAALEAARILLLILSQSACDSPEVENEITQATRRRKVILPVQLEPVALKPGMEYSLRRIHWHDAQQGLTDWALESLLERVERHLEQGKQVPNVDEVMHLTNRAMAGDRDAQFALGEHFEAAHRASLNYVEAVNWFRKAAESRHPEGAYRLALHLRDGIGVLRNEDAALTWFETAAQLGHLQAQTIFANELLVGRRTTANPQEALYWFDRAAEGGSVAAQFQAAVLLDNGRAGIRDPVKAVRWLESAASSGHAGAQFLLANLLFEGKGRAPDLDRARHWAQLATDQGHLAARQLLLRIPKPTSSNS